MNKACLLGVFLNYLVLHAVSLLAAAKAEEKGYSQVLWLDSQQRKNVEEVFGAGTAAVMSPVKQLDYLNQTAYINNGKIGPLTQKLYDTITGIQWGIIPDTKGWIVPVCDG